MDSSLHTPFNMTENSSNGINKSLLLNEFTDVDHHSILTPEAGKIIHRIVLPLICALGILGIVLTVIVLSRKNMCTSTNCFLMALSITDMLFLLVLATTLVENQFTPNSRPFYHYVIYVTYSTIFMHIFLLSSIWLTVILAMERYIAICRPFLAAKLLTINRARVLIVVIFVCAFICRMPNFWENRVVTVYDSTTNSSLSYVEVTDFSINEYYTLLYPWIVDGLMTSMLPFLLLLVLNVRLIWEVRKSTKYIARNLNVPRGGGHTVQKEELQITIMLISVVIVFFLCQAPYVIYTAAVSFRKFAMHSSGFMLFRYITMLLLTLKSAINFIIYCWFSEKFWMTLKRIFCVEHCITWLKFRNDNADGAEYFRMKRYSSCATRDTTMI